MKRIVVIPCRNEEETIRSVVLDALVHADEVFVANDGSTDRTCAEALLAGATVVDVPATRPGLAGAYRFGLQQAYAAHGQAAMYAELDAGGSHDPGALPKFWAVLQLSDIAAGRRFGRGASYDGHWQRKLLSYFGTHLTNAVHQTTFKDATSGFIAYSAKALALLIAQPWSSRGHFYQTELRLRALDLGLSIVEVPIHYRNSGTSLNWTSVREALKLVVR